MNITNQEYSQMAKKASPNSKSFKNVSLAFIFGGAICVVGQILSELYRYFGSQQNENAILTSVSLIGLSALLTGLNVYDNIAKIGGAGTIIPITGFANAVVSPALEFKSEGLILGLGAKIFVIAGPVIVYGLLTGVFYGLIVFIFNL
ncbi:MAG: SpoVA/SpoVAEb family sporulation membrane protein [Oscillospiraceae bacterium]